MASRFKLQEEFEELMGSKSVYYNPPTSRILTYPCIKYSLSGINAKHADDMNYNIANRYKVIVIDPNPDSTIYLEVMNHFKMCSFDTGYVADNLYHRVLTLYY